MQNRANEEELYQVFKILKNYIFPKKHKKLTSLKLKRKRKVIFENIIRSIWKEAYPLEKKAYFLLAFFTLLFSVSFNVAKQTDPSILIWIVLISFIICLALSAVILTTIYIRTTQTSNENERRNFVSSKKEALVFNNLAQELSNNASLSTLKIAETTFKYLIEEYQAKYKTNSSLLPLLAIVCVAIAIYILGFSVGKALLYGLIAGPPGLVAVSALILKFVFEWIIQSRLIKYKKCLLLLEQARAMIEQTDAKNKS